MLQTNKALKTEALDAPPQVKNQAVLDWVAGIVGLTKPDRVYWADGSKEEYDRLCDEMVAAGTLRRLNPAKRPDSYLAWSDPGDVARVEDRTFICSETRSRRRPHQQLDRPGRDAADAGRTLRRLHARPHDVRHSVLDGPAGQPDRADRHPIVGLALCGGQHAADDPHGRGGLGRARQERRVRALRPFGRHAARGRPQGRALALQQDEVHRPLSREPRDLVVRLRLWRQRAARQEVLRVADRLGHGPQRRRGRRQGLARRAHADPRRDLARRAQLPCRGGLPVGLRQDQLRHADPAQGHSRAGRSPPSATTSPGSSPARTAGSTPSTPKPATSASRPAPTTRATTTAWPRSAAASSSPTSR